MTLIMIAGTSDRVIQFADRRLTSGSRVVTDDANKSIVLLCNDGKFLIGYTGLAQATGLKESGNSVRSIEGRNVFVIQDWIINTIFEITKTNHNIWDIVQGLKAKVVKLYEDNNRIRERPLTITFSGFLTSSVNPQAGNIYISNFQEGYSEPGYSKNKIGDFKISQVVIDNDGLFVLPFGDFVNINSEMLGKIERAFRKKYISYEDCIKVIKNYYTKISADRHTIGEHLNVLTLDNSKKGIIAEFHSKDGRKFSLGSMIDARKKDCTIAFSNIEIK